MDPEAVATASVETRVELRCDTGRFHGVVINNRWLEMPCQEPRLRSDGVLTVHIWDLVTGRKSTVYRPKPDIGQNGRRASG